MNIVKYIENFINKLFSTKKNINIQNSIELNKNIYKFTYFATAFNKEYIEILESKDEVGGYFKNKIILPKEISIYKKKKHNLLAYLFRIIFSATSKKLGFYLPKNEYNLEYLLLSSLLTVKTIHRMIFKKYPNTINIIKILYKNIILKEKIKSKTFLLEILMNKLTYSKINKKIALQNDEISWLYEAENIHIYNMNELDKQTNFLYNKLCKIYKNNGNTELNVLWGYLYYIEKINSDKNKIKLQSLNNNITNEDRNVKNVILKNIEFKKANKEYLNINLLFDYKRTVDKYKKGYKNIDDDYNLNENLNILDELNIDNTIKDNSKTSSIYNTNILNENTNENRYYNNIKNKYVYDEWNTKKQKYNRNWCNIYIENINKNIKNDDTLKKTIEANKISILKFKKNIKHILNIKTWKNRQLDGHDIDFDTVIDNYEDSKKHVFEKLYKYKEKITGDLVLSILIDTSLSTDSYSNNEKIIKIIKDTTIFICEGINEIIDKYSVSAFYSNTRYDCRYINIKNFKNSWDKEKKNITYLNPKGYTRIGPAMRHTINNIKNINSKKKAVIIITDGNPTDYDEYEGKYGIEDVRKTITEANKLKINIKGILINEVSKPHFTRMLGINNYVMIKEENKYEKISKIFQDIINQK